MSLLQDEYEEWCVVDDRNEYELCLECGVAVQGRRYTESMGVGRDGVVDEFG